MASEKIPLSTIKQLPAKTLHRIIEKLKSFLKKDDTVIEAFRKYDIDIEEIDTIPMYFADLDVSARTDHGVIYFNYRLLADGDFFKDYAYGVHEITHYLQQTTGKGPTKSSDDDSYLDNPYEQEGFQNQVKFISEEFGDNEAEKYVNKVLDHHDVDNSTERKKRKQTLMKLLDK